MAQDNGDKNESASNNGKLRVLVMRFAIEVLIYAVLLTLYFFLVLRWLAQPLTRMAQENLRLYAPIALLLIVAQGVALEVVTSFLVEQLRLERLG